jgi:hypothetical protein
MVTLLHLMVIMIDMDPLLDLLMLDPLLLPLDHHLRLRKNPRYS